MRPTIVEPADLSTAALVELKNWLGISRPAEDDLLLNLLRASLATCESFTGQAPLTQMVEELVSPRAGVTELTARPVSSFVSAEVVVPGANRTALDASDFAFEIAPPGNACFDLFATLDAQAIAVRARVGIAGSWDAVPAGLKQGMIRLAAFHYRDRDRPGVGKPEPSPPASVTALWRPWRTLRLA